MTTYKLKHLTRHYYCTISAQDSTHAPQSSIFFDIHGQRLSALGVLMMNTRKPRNSTYCLLDCCIDGYLSRCVDLLLPAIGCISFRPFSVGPVLHCYRPSSFGRVRLVGNRGSCPSKCFLLLVLRSLHISSC